MRLPSRATSTPPMSPAGTLKFSSVPAGSGTSSSRSTTRAVNAAAFVEVELVAEPEVHLAPQRLLRDGDAGDPEHDALERGGDRPRVGDVIAEVGAVVDPGDDQVGLEIVDQAERGEPHAVDGSAVACVADRAVLERHLLNPQRATERDRARRRRAVAVGRDHRELDVVEPDQRPPQRLQALGIDAVVVGEEHSQHGRRGYDSTDGQVPSAIRGLRSSVQWHGHGAGHVPYCSSRE